MTEATSSTPVVVAGAGAAGLTTAITLARNGIPTLLFERRRTPSDLPRATVISLRSMEILRSWGLEAEVLAGGVDADWRLRLAPTLARVAEGTDLEVGIPSPAQSAMISPTAAACVPQDHLERVLLRHLRSLPAARVEMQTRVAGIEEGVGALLVRVVHAGVERSVAARYLVGADGAHSAVRDAAGIAMRGPDDLRRVVTALFRAPLWSVVGSHRHGIYSVTDPAGEGTFLPAGDGDRWLYGVDTEDERGPALAWAHEAIAARIVAGAGVPGLEPRIEQLGYFRFAAQLADRFRAGRVLLAGDAAHRVTPRGGTGMNIAMHDGLDLGWRLTWVLRGWAGDDLLDGYEAERRPVAEHNVSRSADPNGSVRGSEEEVHADIGARVAHAWVSEDGERRSTLDLLGPGLTLFAGADAVVPPAGSWSGAPVTVRRVDAAAARRLGLHGSGALMVRPDGVQVALWASTGSEVAPRRRLTA